MYLIIYIVLFFPVYFGLRYAIDIGENLREAGLYSIMAVVMTLVIFILLDWLRGKIWG